MFIKEGGEREREREREREQSGLSTLEIQSCILLEILLVTCKAIVIYTNVLAVKC